MYRYKIKNFVDDVMPHILIDRSFQRKVCWSEKTCREFIHSANLGRAFYPIVVADVKTGLERSHEGGKEYSIEKYEQAENLRKDYISLDGQNRSMAWKKLFNNQVHLRGVFLDADGEEVNVMNAVYSQLPERLQDALRDTEVILSVATQCYYDELHDIFVNINSGDALNPQEIRNAINTVISGFIRSICDRDHVLESLSNIAGFDQAKFDRSYDAEYIAKAYMATLENTSGMGYNLAKKDLDNFYLKGKEKLITNVTEYSKKDQNRFINIIKNQTNILKDQNKVPQKIWWLTLFVSERVLVDNQTKINNYGELYDIVTTLDSKLCDDSRQKMGKDLEVWKQNGEDPEDKPTSSSYYHQWASDPRNPNSRYKRKETFFDAFNVREDYLALVEASKLIA